MSGTSVFYLFDWPERNYDYIVSLSTKIEKEKRELAKQYGMVRTEVSGGEIAEELEKERRMFQLQMCEVSGIYCIEGFLFKLYGGVSKFWHLINSSGLELWPSFVPPENGVLPQGLTSYPVMT